MVVATDTSIVAGSSSIAILDVGIIIIMADVVDMQIIIAAIDAAGGDGTTVAEIV